MPPCLALYVSAGIEFRSSCLDGTHFTDWAISLMLHKDGAVREACLCHWASILFTIAQLMLSKSLPNDSGHGWMSDGKHLEAPLCRGHRGTGLLCGRTSIEKLSRWEILMK